MTLDEFRLSLSNPHPPAGLPQAIVALWHDARGDWDQAHREAQDVPDEDGGAWVHAYLHRKEGDPGNAAYWYRRARQPIARDTLEQEWARIAEALLTR
jgi:hypothetical protein